MGLGHKKAVDIMKKASGCELEERSVTQIPHGFLAVLKGKPQVVCVTDGPCAFADRLECVIDEYRYGARLRFADMNNKNSQTLRFFLKWTAPTAITAEKSSIGFEDDFGLLLPIAVQELQDRNIKPVLMSHLGSNEKLALAMGDAAWQALTAGLLNGYAAEYSYAKSEQEIMNALLCGYTGIVIDIADKIDRNVFDLPEQDLANRFNKFPDDFQKALRLSYLNKTFTICQIEDFSYTEAELQQYALCYGEAIAFAQYIYNAYFKNTPWPVDFTLYIGEFDLPYKEHYLLANELTRVGVKLAAIQLNPTLPSFLHNAQVASSFAHKIRIISSDTTCEILPKVNCHFDLRPRPGSSLLFAYDICKQKEPALAKEISAENVEYNDLLNKLTQNKGKLQTFLLQNKDAYYDLFRISFIKDIESLTI